MTRNRMKVYGSLDQSIDLPYPIRVLSKLVVLVVNLSLILEQSTLNLVLEQPHPIMVLSQGKRELPYHSTVLFFRSAENSVPATPPEWASSLSASSISSVSTTSLASSSRESVLEVTEKELKMFFDAPETRVELDATRYCTLPYSPLPYPLRCDLSVPPSSYEEYQQMKKDKELKEKTRCKVVYSVVWSPTVSLVWSPSVLRGVVSYRTPWCSLLPYSLRCVDRSSNWLSSLQCVHVHVRSVRSIVLRRNTIVLSITNRLEEIRSARYRTTLSIDTVLPLQDNPKIYDGGKAKGKLG